MAEPDAFDPTHALDGWRAPVPEPLDLSLTSLLHAQDALPDEATVSLAGSPAPTQANDFDPTHVLDGWRPPESEPVDLQLRSLAHAESTGLDSAKLARLKARGYEMMDVEDVEVTDLPPPCLAIAEPERSLFEMDAEPAYEAPPVFLAESAVLDGPPAGPTPEPVDTSAAEIETLSPAPSVEEILQFGESIPVTAEAPASPTGEPPGMPVADVEAAIPEPVVEEVASPDEPPPVPVDASAMVPEAPLPSVAETIDPDPCVDIDVEAVQATSAAFKAAPPTGEIEVPEVSEPFGAAEAPALDFHAPPPPTFFDAPVLDFRLPAPSPELDPRQVLDAITLPVVPPQPTHFEAPLLDLAALTPHAAADPRLLADWQPQAWRALARRVADANTEVVQASDGLHVQAHVPQWLCAVWPPQPEGLSMLGRWPELAALVGAETREAALQAVLGELPAEARLWAAELEADWGLLAELVLQQDGELRPAQARALRDLAEAERSAGLARLRDGYALNGRVARRRP